MYQLHQQRILCSLLRIAIERIKIWRWVLWGGIYAAALGPEIDIALLWLMLIIPTTGVIYI